jgi:hypothetical protein
MDYPKVKLVHPEPPDPNIVKINVKDIPTYISGAKSGHLGEVRGAGGFKNKAFIIATPKLLDEFDYHLTVDDEGFLLLVPVEKKKS